MARLYPALPAGVNLTTPDLSARPDARPLPPSLKRYWRLIKNLSKKYGFAFFECEWFMKEFGAKRWKYYDVIEKLERSGAIVVEKLAGSHKRVFWALDLPTRYAPPSGARLASPEPARKPFARAWGEETPEKQAAVRELVARGVELAHAEQAVKKIQKETGSLALDLPRLDGNLVEWRAWRAKGGVKFPGIGLAKAIVENWQPEPGSAPSAPVTVRVSAEPAPTIDAIEKTERMPEGMRERFRALAALPPKPKDCKT